MSMNGISSIDGLLAQMRAAVAVAQGQSGTSAATRSSIK